MINYFEVLGISEVADQAEVKRAYRKLAKEWHPDKSSSPRSAEVFILINEAYQFLLDDDRRASHRLRPGSSARRAQQKRREERYKAWVDKQQYEARKRAAEQARNSYDEFLSSRLYRTAMAMNRAYDYVFFALAGVICLTPLFVLFSPPTSGSQREGMEYVTICMTFMMGGIFMYFIWKNLIKRDQKD